MKGGKSRRFRRRQLDQLIGLTIGIPDMATSIHAFVAASNCPETEENLPPESAQSEIEVMIKSNHIPKTETITVSTMTSSATTTTTTSFGGLSSMCWSTSTTLCEEEKKVDLVHDETGGDRTTMMASRTTTTANKSAATTHTTTATIINATVNTMNATTQVLDGDIATFHKSYNNYPFRRINKLTQAQRLQHRQHRQYRHHRGRLSATTPVRQEEVDESTIGAPSSLSSSSSATSFTVATKCPPPITRMYLDNLHTTQGRKPGATTQMMARPDQQWNGTILSPSTVPLRIRDTKNVGCSDASWTGATMIGNPPPGTAATKLVHIEELEEDYWEHSKITHSSQWYRAKNRVSRHSQWDSSVATTNGAYSTDPPGEKVDFLFEDHHHLATISSSPTSVQLAVKAHRPPTKPDMAECIKHDPQFDSVLPVHDNNAVVRTIATSSPPPRPMASLLSPVIIDLTKRPTTSSSSKVVSTKRCFAPTQPTESPASNQNATMSSMKTVSFRYPVHEIMSFPQEKDCNNNIRRSNNCDSNDTIDVASLYKVGDRVDIMDGMHKDRTGHVVKVSSHGLVQVALLNCWNQSSLYLSPVLLQHRET